MFTSKLIKGIRELFIVKPPDIEIKDGIITIIPRITPGLCDYHKQDATGHKYCRFCKAASARLAEALVARNMNLFKPCHKL